MNSNITINGEQYPVKMGFRALLDFEEMTGKNANQLGELSTKEMIALFYFGIKAGSRKEAKKFNYDFDGFIDLIEDYPEIIEQMGSLMTPEEGK